MASTVDIKKVADGITFIQLEDMQIPINIGRAILADYDQVERDLCVFLVQGYYNQIVQDKGGKLNRAGKERALYIAKYQATKRLSTEDDGLRGLVERSKLFMINDAEQTGWHQGLEYNDVAELLASFAEGKKDSDEAYDWKFIVEQLLPAATEVGIAPGMVMGASLNIGKMRSMVSAGRELLERQKSGAIEQNEARETLENWLNLAINKNVTREGFIEELNQWRGLSVNRKEPLVGYQIMMPNNTCFMVIPTETNKDISLVEQALRNRVDFRITGFDWLQKEVTGQTKSYRLAQEHLDEMMEEMKQEMRKGARNNDD